MLWFGVPAAIVAMGGFSLQDSGIRLGRSPERGQASDVQERAIGHAGDGPTTVADRSEAVDGTNGAEADAEDDLRGGPLRPTHSHYRGRGAISLTVVDANSGEPLTDLPVVVWSERPHTHVYVCGLTDEDGELEIEQLPEDVVIFETARRAPHANTIAATWLADGEHKSLTMEIGHGGTVKGRVVDDLGQPLSGIEVGVDPRPGGAALAIEMEMQWREPHSDLARRLRRGFEPATRTDAEGRYEFGAIRSRAGAIWIEADGAMAPKRDDGVAVIGRFGEATRCVPTAVADGAVVELPDMVFRRPCTLSGRVVEDGSDAPIAGALVTSQGLRYRFLSKRAFDRPWVPPTLEPEPLLQRLDFGPLALAPWEAGFELASEEAITDAKGCFELSTTRSEGSMLLVVTPDWRRKEFVRPKLAAGERGDGIEVRVPAETQLYLEIREEGGAPLQVERRHESGWLLEVRAVLRNGREKRGVLHEAGDSCFGVALAAPPEALQSLILRTAEHRGVTLPVRAPPRDRPTYHVELARRREFLLELDVKVGDEADLENLVGNLSIGALKLPLAEAQAAAAMGDGALLQLIGRKENGAIAGERVTLRLPTGGRWHVVAIGPWGEDGIHHHPVELGTFEPDGVPHEVVLPRVSAAWRARIAEAKARQASQTPIGRGGRVIARFVDAATGQPIAAKSLEGPARWLDYDFPRPIGWWRPADKEKKEGEEVLFVASLLPGDWRVDFDFEGWRPAGTRTVAVVSEATVDLGTIVLESLPEQRLRLVDADGATAAAGWSVELFDAADEQARATPLARGRSDAEGWVTLRCAAPPQLRLRAEAPLETPTGSSMPRATVPFERWLDAWPSHETASIELPPRCEVEYELDLTAVDPDLIDEPWQVIVLDGDRSGRAPDRTLALARPLDANTAVGLPLRRFAVRLYPGTWRLRARSALHVADDALVEIAADGTTTNGTVRRVARSR